MVFSGSDHSSGSGGDPRSLSALGCAARPVALWVPWLPEVGRTSFQSQGWTSTAAPREPRGASSSGVGGFLSLLTMQCRALRSPLASSSPGAPSSRSVEEPSTRGHRGTAPVAATDLTSLSAPSLALEPPHPLPRDKRPPVARRLLPSPPGCLCLHLAVLKRFLSCSPAQTKILMFDLLLLLLFFPLAGLNRSPVHTPPPQLCWKPQLPPSSTESCIFRGD